VLGALEGEQGIGVNLSGVLRLEAVIKPIQAGLQLRPVLGADFQGCGVIGLGAQMLAQGQLAGVVAEYGGAAGHGDHPLSVESKSRDKSCRAKCYTILAIKSNYFFTVICIFVKCC
jgi:hypothetical protein